MIRALLGDIVSDALDRMDAASIALESLRPRAHKAWNRFGCQILGHEPEGVLDVACLCKYCGIPLYGIHGIRRRADQMFDDALYEISRAYVTYKSHT